MDEQDSDVRVEGAEQASSQQRPRSRRKLVLLLLLALSLLGAGGGIYLMLFRGEPDASAADVPDTFVEVEPMQVNLRTGDGSTRLLRVHFVLVPGSLAPDAITARLPLVVDSYQPFLRELRPEDLAGSAATYRVKEEMLIRTNHVLGAGAVKDVLIQDLVQQ